MYKKITFFILLLLLASCHKKTDRQAEAERIVTEWVGKTIQFPADMHFSVYGRDTVSQNMQDTPYKILFFADSMGCTSCKLKLFEWQRLIAEVDTTMQDKVSFLFCFQPKNRKDLIFMFRRDRFNYPVFMDEENEMNRLNHFPDKAEYQCFLLDNENKVLSIGNPTLNPKIWDLYKQIITGETSINDETNTRVEVVDTVVQLNNVKTGEKQKMTFRIKNIGSSPLVISEVKTSCGCTNAEWEKQPVAAGKTTEINADIVLEYEGYFEKTLTVYCNAANSPLTLKIKGNTE